MRFYLDSGWHLERRFLFEVRRGTPGSQVASLQFKIASGTKYVPKGHPSGTKLKIQISGGFNLPLIGDH